MSYSATTLISYSLLLAAYFVLIKIKFVISLAIFAILRCVSSIGIVWRFIYFYGHIGIFCNRISCRHCMGTFLISSASLWRKMMGIFIAFLTVIAINSYHYFPSYSLYSPKTMSLYPFSQCHHSQLASQPSTD